MENGVYIITCVENGRRYVGASGGVRNRWEDHKKLLKSGNHPSDLFQEDYNKYSLQAFIFSVLEIAEDYYVKEKEWIERLKPEYNSDEISREKNRKKSREEADRVWVEEWRNPPPIDDAAEDAFAEVLGEIYALARQDARDYKAKKAAE